MPFQVLGNWSEPRSLLVVEDDDGLRQTLADALGTICARVMQASTLAEATRICADEEPDLVLLDLGLPDGDGSELLHRLREATAVPIIVLSGREDEEQKIQLLDAGADDFVSKPCSAAELIARVRGQLRRSGASAAAQKAVRFVCDGVEIDMVNQRVTRDGHPQRLTPTEWLLLRALVLNVGRPVTPRQLWDLVWDREFGDFAVHVRVHMTHLRRKIEPTPSVPRLIVTDAGVGYRFVAP